MDQNGGHFSPECLSSDCGVTCTGLVGWFRFALLGAACCRFGCLFGLSRHRCVSSASFNRLHNGFQHDGTSVTRILVHLLRIDDIGQHRAGDIHTHTWFTFSCSVQFTGLKSQYHSDVKMYARV